jgi:hypothetical protein
MLVERLKVKTTPHAIYASWCAWISDEMLGQQNTAMPDSIPSIYNPAQVDHQKSERDNRNRLVQRCPDNWPASSSLPANLSLIHAPAHPAHAGQCHPRLHGHIFEVQPENTPVAAMSVGLLSTWRRNRSGSRTPAAHDWISMFLNQQNRRLGLYQC